MLLTCVLFPGLCSMEVCVLETSSSSRCRWSAAAQVSGFISVAHSWRQGPIVWAETLNLEGKE